MILHYLERNGDSKTFIHKQAVYKDRDSIKAGIEAFFIPVSDTVGLKLYADKDSCQRAFAAQQEAYEKGFGPQVIGDMVELEFPRQNFEELMTRYRTFLYHCPERRGYGYYTEIADMEFIVRGERQAFVRHARTMLSYPLNDMHCNNIGRLRGRLVVVDFGENSTTPRDWISVYEKTSN